MKDNKINVWKEQYNQIPIPPNLSHTVTTLIKESHNTNKNKSKISYKILKVSLQVAAIIGIAIIILPNTNAQVAYAMEQIPVIGTITKVVTFREYKVESNHIVADINIPAVENILQVENTTEVIEPNSLDIETLNKKIEDYTTELINTFEEDMKLIHPEGHMSMESDYKVVTDNEKIFTLKIETTISKGGATNLVKYYHIDKKTGNVISLKDLFVEESDYTTIISNNIKEQMIEQMDADEAIIYAYNNDSPGYKFTEIEVDEDFYFNNNNELVIVFDEYQVAAGYMGIVQFVIPKQIIQDIIA